MSKFERKAFLKKMAIMASATAIRPGWLLASPSEAPSVIDLSDGIIDLHCHPSLKIYLLDKKMWKHHHPWPGPNEIHMQVDLTQLKSGCVKGMMATHYLVEASIEKQWDMLKKLWPLLSRIFHRLAGKIENEDESNVSQIMKMINQLEGQLKECNKRQQDIEFVIAKSYAHFEASLQAGKLPVAHAIEGAHALGRNLPISAKRFKEREEQVRQASLTGVAVRPYRMVPGNDPNDPTQYLKNLDQLHECGVCMMTLSHFFRNDIAYPVDGMSIDSKKVPGMAWEYTPDKDHGLTTIGRAVVSRMLEIGMIIDLNHTTPLVRKEVFEINRQFNAGRIRDNKSLRPLVFTHVGAQQIYDYYDQGHYPYYKYYDVSDEEIAAIEECGGVIGVLAENFWLTGADTHLRKEFWPDQFRYGIPYVIETMKYINSRTTSKKFDHVAIGTDFDGLADAPKDLYVHSQLRDLFSAMRADPDISDDDIKKVCYINAQRVLKNGWGI
jgi:microsomal dipeptidase-like Zn-dependent dipeptidase